MFNIAFPELLVICLVVLIVVGPEKLPRIVYGLGTFVGRMQGYLSDIKSDMREEMRLKDFERLQEELRQTASAGEVSPYQEGDVIDHRKEAAASADEVTPKHDELSNPPSEAASSEWSTADEQHQR